MADAKQTSDLTATNLLESTVDQLNDSDAELLNLLTAGDDCTDILQNIATNEQFEQLINHGAEFSAEETFANNMQDFIHQENYNGICDNIQQLQDNTVNDCLDLSAIDITAVQNSVTEQKIGKFRCAHCDKICTTKKLLKYHLMTHTGSRPYSCDICSKTFKHNYEVKIHKRSHNRPTLQCDICSKMFIHKSHLTAHRRKHVGDFVAYCKDCNKGFISQSTYKNHVKVQHEKVVHICDICGLKLSTLSALNEHKLTHDPNYKNLRSHICDMCGKSYLNNRNLRSHMKTHTQINSYICNICGKSLSGKKILETHIKMHTGEKDFICKFCSKAFSSKEYLTTHERTHTGDKPFRCQICNKSFTQKISLTVHLRCHTGEKPYKCHCGKGFVTKSHLHSHYKTHDISNIDFGYVPQQI